MAGATNGGNNGGGGGGKVISMPLQYFCVLAAVVVFVMVLSLSFMSPAAMVAVRQNLGSSAAAAAAPRSSSSNSTSSGAAGLAAASPKEKEKEQEQARRPPHVVLFNFGDSNSDTGGVAAVMGIRIAPPEGRAYFHHPTGRLSDGRVILDFICESLGTPHLSPFMKPLGSNYTHGVNFAIAGSTATPGTTTFSLDVQVDQFVFFKERCLDLIDRGEAAPIEEKAFPDAIYFMDIGHNDINGVLHLPYHTMLEKLPPVIAEIKKAIERLHKNGARKFWIHGTGALGCMPQKLSMPRDDDSDLDEHGCIATINNVCKKFNSLLSEALDELRLTLKSSTIVFVDMFAIKYDLVANHTKYGIEKPLMTCCGHGGPPYNYDPKESCMTSDKYLCKLGEKFISWDGVHFTDAANGIVASKVLSGEYNIPRVKLTSLLPKPKSDE